MLIRDRLSGWGGRLSFGALLLLFSEWIVWQTPTSYNLLEWIALAGIYLAMAAVMLDLIVRLKISEIGNLLLLGGFYGLVNGTIISHVATSDLPLSLIVRPLSAQPLAFIGALAAFQLLTSERATGPLHFIITFIVGLVWGVWVRWFPIISDAPIPAVEIETAVAALAIGLVAVLVIRLVLPPENINRREDWLLNPVEGLLAGGILLVTLVVGYTQRHISGVGLGIVLALLAFMMVTLYITLPARRKESLLAAITPPRKPNPAAWVILIIPFLVAGWIGYNLPGSGDSAPQSDLLFGALMGFGIVWLPAVSSVMGVRAFMQLAREGG